MVRLVDQVEEGLAVGAAEGEEFLWWGRKRGVSGATGEDRGEGGDGQSRFGRRNRPYRRAGSGLGSWERSWR